jgi:hypothetical protein
VKARAARSAAVSIQRPPALRARWGWIASLVCGLAGTYTGRADAHSLLDQPAPRDRQDGYKDGSACGVSFDAAQPVTHYVAGQTIQVQWLETVDHSGCFLVELSAGGDQDFQILGRKSHSNPPAPEGATSAEPRHWSLDVTLPAAACSGCTLRLRQLMLDEDVPADACSAVGAPPGSTYTTCANITVGSVDGAPATPAADESSCSLHRPRGHSLVLAMALAVVVLRRRRRELRCPGKQFVALALPPRSSV